MYSIELSQNSAKILDKIKEKDKKNFEILVSHMKTLEENPEHSGKKLLGNLRGLYSYRAGDFRIIFQIRKESNIVFVITIGNRRDVYE